MLQSNGIFPLKSILNTSWNGLIIRDASNTWRKSSNVVTLYKRNLSYAHPIYFNTRKRKNLRRLILNTHHPIKQDLLKDLQIGVSWKVFQLIKLNVIALPGFTSVYLIYILIHFHWKGYAERMNRSPYANP